MNTAPSRKLKILMLCGYIQNPYVFRGRIAAIRKSLESIADLVFVDPPHAIPAQFLETGDPASLNTPEAQSMEITKETPRGWWYFSKQEFSSSKGFRGIDESLKLLRTLVETEQFDGVFGFSQGAGLAGIIIALMERPSLDPVFANIQVRPLKFGIIVSGFDPRGPRQESWFDAKPSTPVLHVIGKTDQIVENKRSEAFVQLFENVRLENHAGGHFTPSKGPWKNFFKDFVAQFLDEGSGWEGVKSIASPEPKLTK